MRYRHVKLNFLLSVLLGMIWSMDGMSQEVALKTNLLAWGTVSPNLGMELGLGAKSTLDFYASVNPFRFGGKEKQWKHWLVMPEYRYWFCEKFNGHFIGLHLLGGEYNIAKAKLPFGVYPRTKEARFEGWGVGGGFSYGYQWLLSRHWSIEGTLGVGYVYSRFEKYPCAECGRLLDSGTKHYVGLTRAAINLIYVF